MSAKARDGVSCCQKRSRSGFYRMYVPIQVNARLQ